jgi:hypothetical protein
MIDPTCETAHAALKAGAWRILSTLSVPPARALRVRARNPVASVTVAVLPCGTARAERASRQQVA